MSDDLKTYRCDCNVIHEEVVEAVRGRLENADELNELANVFKVLGDLTRIKIITVLRGNEMCVCDLAVSLDMTQSAISHQLRVLKQARLVRARRDGKIMYYSLDDAHIDGMLDMGFDHIRHD